jgi:hypothetical protein
VEIYLRLDPIGGFHFGPNTLTKELQKVRSTSQTAFRIIFAILLSGAMISTFPTSAQLRGDGKALAQPVVERLGKDDGFALAIHYSGDLHGSLETCG